MTLVISTPSASPTSRNLLASGRVRIGIGPNPRPDPDRRQPRGPFPTHEIADELGDAFAAKTGFDPRELVTPYTWFRIQPERVQAWREANELDGRDLMRDGLWLVS